MQAKAWVLGSVGVAALVAAGCGGGKSSSTTSAPTAAGYYITISNLAFSPLNLRAPAGATVTVLNQDSMQHDVTSEARSGAYTPGSVAGVSFETGPFTGNQSFTLPAGVPNGTVITYYCNIHKQTMATPNATITIDATAQAAPPPGGTATPAPMGGGGGY